MEDDPRPVEATTPELEQTVETLVLKDGFLKKKQHAEMIGISATSILNMHNHFGMTKIISPYSPDLTPSDYYLLPKMKNQIRGKKLTDESSQLLKVFLEGINKLIEKYGIISLNFVSFPLIPYTF